MREKTGKDRGSDDRLGAGGGVRRGGGGADEEKFKAKEFNFT